MSEVTPASPERRWIAPVASAVVALLVGVGIGYAVGSSGDDDKPEPAAAAEPTPTETTPTEEPTPSEEATPTPTSPSTYRLKDEVDLTVLKVTVYSYRRDLKDPSGYTPDAGMRWDEALIRICNVSVDDADLQTSLSGYGNWSLLDSDDGAYQELDLSPSPATAPQWNYDRKIAPGACQKGWLGFDLPKAAKVGKISFSPDGTEAARWGLY